MIKNAVLALASLVALLSGVGMVSAYESHVINVEAHVENALEVPTSMSFGPGAVFPEEWLVEFDFISLSISFCNVNQTRVSHVDFRVWMDETPGIAWLGDALYLKRGGKIKPTGAAAMTRADTRPPAERFAPPTEPIDTGVTGSLFKATEENPAQAQRTRLWVGLDVPVFEGFYNALTDPVPKPSGLDAPSVIIAEDDTPRYFPEAGVDLGVDLIVQVTDIHNSPALESCSQAPEP